MNSVPQIAPKKPYHQPSLRVYGNIEALTATVSNITMNADGGINPTNKTH